MREKIKKILREYNELDWIDDITAEPVIVSKDNVYLGAKVRLVPESKYNYDEWFDQLVGVVGEIVLHHDKSLFKKFDDGFWVKVTWKTPNGRVAHQHYRVGPDDFDLIFAA
jgi:hypothetical protein